MRLEQQPSGADVARRLAFAVHRRRGENRDFGQRLDIVAPRLFLLDLGIGFADQLISALVELAVRVELVADAAFRAVGQHRGALVAQRVRMLDPAEFPPGRMEFPGHAEKVQPEVPAVGGRHRVVVVPPAAGRQAFEFEVAEMFQDFRVADRHVAAVVEHRHVGIEFPRRGVVRT